MPKCVQCGAETAREDMFGAGADLRCAKCAQVKRGVYTPAPPPRLRLSGTLTSVIIGFSIFVFLTDSLAHAGIITSPYIPSHYLVAIPRLLWDGELWRLVTSIFVHGDILHVLFNCYWLWQFGIYVESWLGRLVYIGFVALVAFASMGAEVLVSNGVPIGLSGVVYGIFGLLFAYRRHKDFAAALLPPQTVQVLVFWFFLCFILNATGSMRIANWAHAVGALSGWLLGQATLPRARKYYLPGLVMALIALGGATMHMPYNGDYCLYRASERLAAGDVAGFTRWQKRAENAIVAPRAIVLPFEEE